MHCACTLVSGKFFCDSSTTRTRTRSTQCDTIDRSFEADATNTRPTKVHTSQTSITHDSCAITPTTNCVTCTRRTVVSAAWNELPRFRKTCMSQQVTRLGTGSSVESSELCRPHTSRDELDSTDNEGKVGEWPWHEANTRLAPRKGTRQTHSHTQNKRRHNFS